MRPVRHLSVLSLFWLAHILIRGLYANSIATDPEAPEAKAKAEQSSGYGSMSAKTRRVYTCLYHNTEKAKLGASQSG